MNKTEQILLGIEGNPLQGLQKADQLWSTYKEGSRQVRSVVTECSEALAQVEYDVAICGGTLGILLGAALAQKGWQVALLEKGIAERSRSRVEYLATRVRDFCADGPAK